MERDCEDEDQEETSHVPLGSRNAKRFRGIQPHMMTCRELIEQLIDYLDGTLPREAFDHHRALCPSCRAYVDSYLATIRLVKTLT